MVGAGFTNFSLGTKALKPQAGISISGTQPLNSVEPSNPKATRKHAVYPEKQKQNIYMDPRENHDFIPGPYKSVTARTGPMFNKIDIWNQGMEIMTRGQVVVSSGVVKSMVTSIAAHPAKCVVPLSTNPEYNQAWEMVAYLISLKTTPIDIRHTDKRDS